MQFLYLWANMYIWYQPKTKAKIYHFDDHTTVTGLNWWKIISQLTDYGVWLHWHNEGVKVAATLLKYLEDIKINDQHMKHYMFQTIDRVGLEQISDRTISKIICNAMKTKFGEDMRGWINLFFKL